MSQFKSRMNIESRDALQIVGQRESELALLCGTCNFCATVPILTIAPELLTLPSVLRPLKADPFGASHFAESLSSLSESSYAAGYNPPRASISSCVA